MSASIHPLLPSTFPGDGSCPQVPCPNPFHYPEAGLAESCRRCAWKFSPSSSPRRTLRFTLANPAEVPDSISVIHYTSPYPAISQPDNVGQHQKYNPNYKQQDGARHEIGKDHQHKSAHERDRGSLPLSVHEVTDPYCAEQK